MKEKKKQQLWSMKGRMSVPMSKMFRWIALLNMLISISRSALLPPRLQTIRSIAVRDFVVQPSIFAMALLAGQQAVLARSTLAPPPGVDSSGMLSPCPDDSLVQCVSSQDDRPACFLAPWEFDGEWTNARTKLVAYVLKAVPGSRLVSGVDATGSANNPSRYLRFEVLNKDVVDDLGTPSNLNSLTSSSFSMQSHLLSVFVPFDTYFLFVEVFILISSLRFCTFCRVLFYPQR